MCMFIKVSNISSSNSLFLYVCVFVFLCFCVEHGESDHPCNPCFYVKF